jgi:hypothetical protein
MLLVIPKYIIFGETINFSTIPNLGITARDLNTKITTVDWCLFCYRPNDLAGPNPASVQPCLYPYRLAPLKILAPYRYCSNHHPSL